MSNHRTQRFVGYVATSRGASLNAVLLSLLLAGSMFVGSDGGAAPVDALLVLLLAQAAVSAKSLSLLPEIEHSVNRMAAAIVFLLGLATLSILMFGGDASRLLVDLVSFGYLIVPLVLLSTVIGSRQMSWLSWAAASSAATFAVVTVIEADGRGTGFMANPNMTAIWMGLALLLFASKQTPLPRPVRWAVCALLIAALVATDSYSAAIGIGIAAAYVVGTRPNRVPTVVLVGAAALLVWLLRDDLFRQGTEPERLASSSGSRSMIWGKAWDTWQANPFGIGHGSFVQDGVYASGVQVHNDYLTALVEQGFLGLIALLVLGCAIFRSGYKLTRAMLVFVAVTAFFHDVLNFRHVWIFLAIGLAVDLHAKASRAEGRTTIE